MNLFDSKQTYNNLTWARGGILKLIASVVKPKNNTNEIDSLDIIKKLHWMS